MAFERAAPRAWRRAALGHGLERRQHGANAREGTVGEVVEHPASVSPGDDESRVAERAEVVRDEGLAEASQLHQFGDASLGVDHEFEEPEPRFIAEGAKSQGGNGSGAGGVIHAPI